MDTKNQKSFINKEYAKYLTLGTELTLYILVLMALGYWADLKFSSSPLLIITGSILGIFVGFYKFFKSVAKINNNKNQNS